MTMADKPGPSRPAEAQAWVVVEERMPVAGAGDHTAAEEDMRAVAGITDRSLVMSPSGS
jgi:hypothetical protein